VPIWLPHSPACMCAILREEAAWRRGARERKRAGRAEKRKELRVVVWHGKQSISVARSRDPERKIEVVLPLQLLELWAPCKTRWVWAGVVAKHFFSHVSIAVRQGQQRREAAAAGEEKLGRCSAGRLYPSRRCTFGEFGSLADSFAAGSPLPTHV
jgi:hypothetical protein